MYLQNRPDFTLNYFCCNLHITTLCDVISSALVTDVSSTDTKAVTVYHINEKAEAYFIKSTVLMEMHEYA